MKQKYYSTVNIKKTNSDYNIILGERSNGKSYAVKHDCISDAYKDKNKKFIYLRRWDLEIKQNLIDQYFADANIPLITNGEYEHVIAFHGGIFLANADDKGKFIKGVQIGYARALSMEEHYTSGIYTDCSNVIFEEFISRTAYLPNEPQKLQQFISTIARRNKIKIWMIGNTISRLCPYFSEWELRNVPRQKQGTIEIYEHKTDQLDEKGNSITIRIAVEYAENSGNNSKMFFGSSSKMITSGIWQSEEKQHIIGKETDYNKMYEVIIEFSDFKFYAQFLIHKTTNNCIWFISPKTTEIQKNTRIISDKLYNSVFATRGFIPISKNEVIAFDYLKQGKICYSDNLTGSDFEVCLKQLLTI